MNRSLGRMCCVLTIALCVMGPQAARAQQSDEAFKKGLEARDEKSPKYDEVIRYMRLAIEGEPAESPRTVRYGGLFAGIRGKDAPYLPHYYLGEALYQQGDCAGALEQWTVSEQQNVIHSRKEYQPQVDKMQEGYKACGARGLLPPAEFNLQLSSARQAINEAIGRLQRAVAVRDSRADVWRAEWNDQLERAAGELRTGQQRLGIGTKSRAVTDFAEAKASADRATVIVSGLEKLVNEGLVELTAVQRQVREVEQALEQGDTADRAIESSRVELTSALATTRQSARDLLKRARDRMREGQASRSLNVVNDALRNAQDGRDRLAGVLDQVQKLGRAQFNDTVTVATQAVSFMENSLATVSRLTSSKPTSVTPELTAKLARIQKDAATIRRRFESARRSEDVGAIEQVVRQASAARVDLDAVIQSFGPATLTDRGVRPELIEGARLFFAGEYQQVISALNPDDPALADAPLQLHVHLFRAAAFYTLYVRAGDKGQDLRQKALVEVEQCKHLEPGFVPDPHAFSPRFISFFQNGGAQAAPRRAGTGTE